MGNSGALKLPYVSKFSAYLPQGCIVVSYEVVYLNLGVHVLVPR